MKRWLGLLVVLAAGAILAIALAPRLWTAEMRFQTIRPGMSRADVIRIMGEPDEVFADRSNPIDTGEMLVWNVTNPKVLIVSIGSNGLVKTTSADFETRSLIQGGGR
jgi:hypothetical protein